MWLPDCPKNFCTTTPPPFFFLKKKREKIEDGKAIDSWCSAKLFACGPGWRLPGGGVTHAAWGRSLPAPAFSVLQNVTSQEQSSFPLYGEKRRKVLKGVGCLCPAPTALGPGRPGVADSQYSQYLEWLRSPAPESSSLPWLHLPWIHLCAPHLSRIIQPLG